MKEIFKLTSLLSLAYVPNSAASKGGGTPLALLLKGVSGRLLLALSLKFSPLLLPPPLITESLNLKLPLSARLLKLNNPSPRSEEEAASADVADPGVD